MHAPGIEITGPGPDIYNDAVMNKYAVPLTFSHVRINHVDVHDNTAPSANNPLGTAVGLGIYLLAADDAVVEKCRVYRNGNNAFGTTPFPDTGNPFVCYSSNHVLFQYNESHHNHTGGDVNTGYGDMGFDFDIFTMNSIMQFNYSHDNDGYGYMFGATLSGQAVFDKPVNINNVIRFNISANDCGSGSGSSTSPYGSLLFEDWPVTDAYVYNNTFYMGDNGLGAPTIGFRFSGGNTAIPQIGLYNNLLLTKDGNVSWYDNNAGFPEAGIEVGGNVLYNNSANATAPPVNGMPLGMVADPKLAFENNPSAPSIADIRLYAYGT